MGATAAQVDSHEHLLGRLAQARSMTDDLFRIVRTEALYDRPIPERHRIVFYIGHLEAFDWNLIADQALDLGPAHKVFDRLFAFGIDPVGGGLPTDQPADWPRWEDVRAYCEQVRQQLDGILCDDANLAARWKYSRETILNVAIEHRLMHAETLAYMLHQLPTEKKVRPANYRPLQASLAGPPTDTRMVEIPAGPATLGISRRSRTFGWDNEFQSNAVDVPTFAIHVCKITNGEFLRFMNEGGYDNLRFWSDADWTWVREQKICHPRFWHQREGQWFYQGMFEAVPLPLDWPVYVSHAEASAYARYVGRSLPTEAQFHRAAYGSPEGAERVFPWGDAAPDPEHGNFDFERWDPAAVGSYPAGRSAFGLEDALGNGWEWTSTQFAPFPGFEPFPFYPGYSANFFDGQHYVMKGASPRTAACMLRRSFRNWFQAHYPFVYASFRCVNSN
ncbi:MAG TPA: SUMF1/EgtB/PvdO family nonheme iron enzyme [Terriglobia bacterium]|nr:SUMF1/EgtB/PvdO family nonheme iron enzyme [Terriglobia bacterium]